MSVQAVRLFDGASCPVCGGCVSPNLARDLAILRGGLPAITCGSCSARIDFRATPASWMPIFAFVSVIPATLFASILIAPAIRDLSPDWQGLAHKTWPDLVVVIGAGWGIFWIPRFLRTVRWIPTTGRVSLLETLAIRAGLAMTAVMSLAWALHLLKMLFRG